MQAVTVQQQPEKQNAAYRLERVDLAGMPPPLVSEWRQWVARNPSGSPMHDPVWLAESFASQTSRLFVYLLFDGDQLCGVAPFLLKDWPLKCQLGEIAVASLPCRRLCLLGGPPHFPADPKALDLLFRELPARERDIEAIYLPDIPVTSSLWQMTEGSAVRQSYLRYVPDAVSPRILLRLEGSFDDYMTKFSSKHRKNMRRSLQALEDKGPVTVMHCSRPEEIEAFLDRAIEISRKTYQWNLLGLGLRDREKLRKHFQFLAGHGWLRCYLLLCGDVPVSFILGFQHGETYFLDDMGYDPDWRDLSVGKILQLKVVEDLFATNPPAVYDLGEYGPHKEEFGNDSFGQGKVYLFRRALYPRMIRMAHSGFGRVSNATAGVLERFGAKKKLKKLIRLWSSR